MSVRKILYKVFNNFELYLCQFLLAAFVVIIFFDVLFRNLFHYSIPWASELSVYMNVWFAYFGAAFAAGKFLHNRITSQFLLFPPIVKKICIIITDLVWIVFNLVFFYLSYNFVFFRINKFWTSQTLHVHMKWIYIVLPIGFLLITIRIIQANYKLIKNIPFDHDEHI